MSEGATLGRLHLVSGDDDSLRNARVSELVHELLAGADLSLALDDVDVDGEGGLPRGLAAAEQPPMFTERRVVVLRNVDRLDAESMAALVAYLPRRSPTTDLVLSGRRTSKLATAVTKAGGVSVGSDVASKRADQLGFVRERVAVAGVHLDPPSVEKLAGHLGGDLGRLDALLATLVSTYGERARLTLDELGPFLGEAGDVPPWDLTDAIDRGDITVALGLLSRMLEGGGRHPLVVLATLTNHYTRMLQLDGSGAAGEQAAAEVLGLKGSTLPAKKALEQLRRLGPEGVREAVLLLAQADLDLRGARQLGPQEQSDRTVLEVLVARLANLSRRSGAGRSPSRGRR